jgi:oligoribonuclease (3'-5' exoribonuclease)
LIAGRDIMFRFPYVSIDIETTGLDKQKSHVLQIAAIYDNGKALEELATFNRVIKWKNLGYGEEYAMTLNKRLLEQDKGTVSVARAREDFISWLSRVQPKGRLTAAGKNVQGFDLPILTNPVNGFKMDRFLRRVLDPGSMFAEDFNHVPNLSEINNITGRKEVSHNALEDAWDVVHAIRYKWRV